MQEEELLAGAEELEKLERQLRSSAGRASHDWAPAGGRRRSGAPAAAEEPLLDRSACNTPCMPVDMPAFSYQNCGFVRAVMRGALLQNVR